MANVMSGEPNDEGKEGGWFAKWAMAANRFETLTQQLTEPSVLSQPTLLRSLSKERADLEEVSQLFLHQQSLLQETSEAQRLLADPETDPDMQSLASEELVVLAQRRQSTEEQAFQLLFPQNADDDKNTFVEIRAGTGGEEAALFAAELVKMYVRFSEKKGLRVEVIESHETEMGGVKQVVLLVEGKGAYGYFQFESGVHRVQRVPTTEASGRIHTSAATVAVMPEVEEVDVHIDQKDLKIDTYCSSGAGGQSVNTTYSAIRITHLPTGVVVTCQDERSQLKNKAKAMRTLRARIGDAERAKQESSIAANRRAQVGSGDRSEKIRTYNYPQNRVTDHRIGLSLHKLELILGGDLDEMVGALKASIQPEMTGSA